MSFRGRPLEQALAAGRIDRSIPFIMKVGVEMLTKIGDSMGLAEQVAQRLRQHYRENHREFFDSHRKTLEEAIREIQTIFDQNVFPEMKPTWGTYANNIGHQNFPGCFRGHDGEQSSKDGRTIQ